MSVGDFDGDGEYEIVVKWRAESPDPMFSDPVYSPDFNLSAPEYIDVYKLNGKLLMTVIEPDTLGQLQQVAIDTAEFVMMDRDTLVLRFNDGLRNYYRKKETSQD